jgi:hypothetical protein
MNGTCIEDLSIQRPGTFSSCYCSLMALYAFIPSGRRRRESRWQGADKPDWLLCEKGGSKPEVVFRTVPVLGENLSRASNDPRLLEEGRLLFSAIPHLTPSSSPNLLPPNPISIAPRPDEARDSRRH